MKKFFTFLFFSFCALLMNAQTYSISDYTIVSTADKPADEFSTTTEIVSGLTAYASSSGVVTIDLNNKSINDYSFTQRLKLGGSGSFTDDETPEYRVVAFDITGSATITVYGMASSSSATTDGSDTDRPLKIDAGSTTNNLYSKAVAGDAISANTCTYSGDATTIFVYSGKSGINIYGIDVEYTESTGIGDIPFGAEVVSTEYYNLSGTLVGSETTSLKNGVYIKKITYDTGDVVTSKISVIR